MDDSSSLTKRLTVSQVVAVYETSTRQIRDALAQIAAAEKALRDTLTLDGSGHIGISHHDYSATDPDRGMASIRKDSWRAVIERLEVRRMMSVARAKELDRQLEAGELPEITAESVAQLVHGFEANLPVMLEEAVEEVFDFLRPHNERYKTNSQLEIPSRVILSWMVERWSYGRGSWHVDYRTEPKLTALENVFHALDGRGQITREHHSDLFNAIQAAGPDGVGETELFRFRACKNRNLHIEFKRLDLLARLNALAGGKRLRPSKDAA